MGDRTYQILCSSLSILRNDLLCHTLNAVLDRVFHLDILAWRVFLQCPCLGIE